MDIEECYRRMMSALIALLAQRDKADDDDDLDHECIIELIDHVEALDEWIRKGGALPKRWSAAQCKR